MSRKGKLKDIAYCLSETFNSRNNDLAGYWGIGQLYRHAVNMGSNQIALDLLVGTIEPAGQFYEKIARYYRRQLLTHLEKRGVAFEVLTTAEIRISFKDSTGAQPFRAAYGDPYVCDVILVAERGAERWCRKTGYCWPHNPEREIRSTRGEIMSRTSELCLHTPN